MAKKSFIAIFIIISILTATAGRMFAVDNNNGGFYPGWRPSILLRTFNSNPVCKQVNYNNGNTNCLAAYDDEGNLADGLLLIDFLVAIGGLGYLGRQWYKKRR